MTVIPTTPTSTPQQRDSKRTRRQSKITDSFSVGRRSGSAQRTVAKEAIESPILARKKAFAKRILDDAVVNGLLTRSLTNEPETIEIYEDKEGVHDGGEERVIDEGKVVDEGEVAIPTATATTIATATIAATTIAEQDRKYKAPISLADLPIIPAYQRFAHLISGPRPLPLPPKFLLLERILGALDSLCMLAAGRDQPVIFHKILKSLESSVGRRVEMSHIEQIHGVFMRGSQGEPPARTPPYEYRPVNIIFQGKRTSSIAFELPEVATHDYLAGRRADFLRRATEVVTEQHNKFLESIAVDLPAGSKLRSWHPKFVLDSVKDLPCVPLLPQPTTTSIVRIPTEISQVIVEAEITKQPKEQSIPIPHEQEGPPPSSVLDRIKAKQRKAELLAMSHDPKKDSERKRLQMLLDFVEIIAMLFSTMEKSKSSMLLGDAINKIIQGSKSNTSEAEIIEKIKDLNLIVPDWIKIVNTGSVVKTLRLDRSQPLGPIREAILTRLQEQES